MKVKLLGYMPLNFTSSDGKNINGTSLFVAFEAQNVHGLKCEKVYVNSDITLPSGLAINDILEITFNMKGKVETVTSTKKV